MEGEAKEHGGIRCACEKTILEVDPPAPIINMTAERIGNEISNEILPELLIHNNRRKRRRLF